MIFFSLQIRCAHGITTLLRLTYPSSHLSPLRAPPPNSSPPPPSSRIDYEDSTEAYNPYLQQFVAAWFKIHLNYSFPRTDFWENMVYGTGPTSLCHGGDGAMKKCEVLRGTV